MNMYERRRSREKISSKNSLSILFFFFPLFFNSIETNRFCGNFQKKQQQQQKKKNESRVVCFYSCFHWTTESVRTIALSHLATPYLLIVSGEDVRQCIDDDDRFITSKFLWLITRYNVRK